MKRHDKQYLAFETHQAHASALPLGNLNFLMTAKVTRPILVDPEKLDFNSR
jgi:hypothetical protein